jgi:hypothetical protein
MKECQQKIIYGIGFIDTYVANCYNVEKYTKDTEFNLFSFLREQNTKSQILFPYNFEWVLLSY